MVDSGRKLPENRIHLFDPMALVNERYAPRPRRTTGPYDGGGLQLAAAAKVDSDSYGSSPSRHLQPLSPNSRSQAISRGRRELMEMIKDIPESCYDLSLRDIVDPKPTPPPLAVEADKKLISRQHTDDSKEKKKKKKVGKSESKKKMVRNPSVDNGGFLLKTSVFPIRFRSRKKRSLKQAASFRVAAKPPTPKIGSGEKDWWGRKSRVPIESESIISTSRQRQGQSNRFLPSCCSFFNDKRIKPNKFITASSNL